MKCNHLNMTNLLFEQLVGDHFDLKPNLFAHSQLEPIKLLIS